MKKSLLFLIIVFITGCEEVVQPGLDEAEPRLVIEASLYWVKGSEGNNQQIRLTKTAPYYQEINPPVEQAAIKVISEEGEEFDFEHSSDGFYYNSIFKPVLGREYRLKIEYNEEFYSATEKLIPVTDIDYVEQNTSGGFSGDEIEIKTFYTDPPGEENHYLFIFRNNKTSMEIYEDKFTDGNQIFGYFSNEDINPGDSIEIEMYGISRDYYNYLFILRSQIGGGGGGPFETRPATVKGNIVNQDNPDNYPFGYFQLSEVDTTTYIVE